MLEIVRLVKEYKSFRAVDDLSFRIERGEIVGLLGQNGAGKTTTLRCIAGILRSTTGRILINGHDLERDQAKAKKGLAFVPELPSLYELLTVDEHLKFVAMCFDSLAVYKKHGTGLLERYDLIEKKDELVATLSKGMRQKLSVACAMVHEANVLLFDEPLIGIDPQGVHEVKQDIQMAKQAGCSVLISTHLLDTAEKLCDRVIILSRGKMLASGTLEELRSAANMSGAGLEDIFLRLTDESQDAR